MAYIDPKTNWKGSDTPTDQDFNRIEGNIEDAKNILDDIETGDTVFSGVKTFSDSIKTDTINDISGSGVAVGGVNFKDGKVYGLVWGA